LGRSYLPSDSGSHDPHYTPKNLFEVKRHSGYHRNHGVTIDRDLWRLKGLSWGHCQYHGWNQWSTSFILMYHTIYFPFESIFTMTADQEGVPRLAPSQNLIFEFAWSIDWRKQNVRKSNGSKVIVQADDKQRDSIIHLKVDPQLNNVNVGKPEALVRKILFFLEKFCAPTLHTNAC